MVKKLNRGKKFEWWKKLKKKNFPFISKCLNFKNLRMTSLFRMNSGDQLDINNFEVIQRIGTGTFSEVFVVKEKNSGKFYAAKVPLKPINEFRDSEKKDINREFSIMCKLNHPAILKMIGYCSENFNGEEKPTIITEFYSNGTLSQKIAAERENKQQDNWDDTTKLIILYGIASAMLYLHSHNVIHRDLKPSNILMDSKNRPKIADFGLTKITRANENTLEQSTVNTKGTPIYIPPELWQDNKYSSAGDVYAFGITAYEIMTCQVPYRSYKNIQPRKLSKLVIEGNRPDMDYPIPEIYKNLIESCWHQDADSRPTFQEIVDELRNNSDFITENVDKDKFLEYVHYIDNYKATFDSEKQDITLEDIEKMKSKLNQSPSSASFSFSFANKNAKIDINDFEIIQRIGSGSFSSVFLVKEKKTSDLYAAKVPLRPISEYLSEDLKNIRREISNMCRLNHPAILKMIGFSLKSFNNEDKPTIITEFLSNGSLYDIIQAERLNKHIEGWDDTAKLIVLYGIASAMKFLHQYDIIHRDLNLKNVLLDSKKRPKIGDFGLSKITRSKNKTLEESTYTTKGTPFYMPPELLESNMYSKAGDVYAFAIMVFEIMTLKKPYCQYNNLNFSRLSKMVIEGVRPEIDSPIPDAYKELIESCWKQDSESRPTFEEIADVLKNNKGFITKKVDENKYFEYVNYIDTYNSTFDPESLDENNSEVEKDSHYYFELAERYYNGDDAPVDREKAAQNYKLAAERNHLQAKFFYGNMLFNGDGIPQNQELGLKYIKEASNNGHIEAMYILASLLESGKGMDVDTPAAAELYLKAAKNGHAEAQFAYAKMLEDGIVVPINRYKAFEYTKMAANNEHTEAIFNYGLALFQGFGTSINLKDAIHYLKIAADKGHPESMMTYSSILFNGNGAEINKTEAVKYYKIAADRGVIDSMYIIADIYFNGDGTDVDYIKAAKYYKLAADKGHIDAMLKYANCLFEGKGVKINKVDSYKYYKLAADNGNAKAMYKYATALFEGTILPLNKEVAINYFRRGARCGNKDCMHSLGLALLRGDGIGANREEAAKYFRMENE